jgi:molecular chaperone DnaJ
MVPKDYYLILGVSRSESPSGIHARYRDLARALHPDVAGIDSTRAFQEIAEAYAVLANPDRRRHHNAELAQREMRRRVETLEPSVTLRGDPVSLSGHPEMVRPSFEALVERLFRNFTELDAPTAERPEGLTVEVLLTPEEAARGVVVPIGVPRFQPCPDCGGTGYVWLFPCWSCDQQGVIASEDIVHVTIPPLSAPGAVIERPLIGLGIHNLYLRAYVRIE